MNGVATDGTRLTSAATYEQKFSYHSFVAYLLTKGPSALEDFPSITLSADDIVSIMEEKTNRHAVDSRMSKGRIMKLIVTTIRRQ